MDRTLESKTSGTLLGRISQDPTDSTAWPDFVERYGRKIYAWCRRWKLQEADALDVTQDVLLKLAVKMKTFVYDPSRSFRGWLRTLTHNVWQDFLDARRKAAVGSGDSQIMDMLHRVEARDDLVAGLREEFERDLLEEAMRRVQSRVSPRAWDAFRLFALEECSGASVASELGMTVAAVFVTKGRLQRMLRAEVAKLEGAEPE